MKKLSLYVFLGLLWCNVGDVSAECKGNTCIGLGGMTYKPSDLPKNYLCVPTKDTAMDKTSVPNDVKVLIGEKNFSDQDIQDLFEQKSNLIIKIKHIGYYGPDGLRGIKEIKGLDGIFSGEFMFMNAYEPSSTGFGSETELASHPSNTILFDLFYEPAEEQKDNVINEKRPLYLKAIELTEEQYQKLLPYHFARYQNGKNGKMKKPYDESQEAFLDEVVKIIAGREMYDFVVGYACFQELFEW